jgi:hypothetical protein
MRSITLHNYQLFNYSELVTKMSVTEYLKAVQHFDVPIHTLSFTTVVNGWFDSSVTLMLLVSVLVIGG